MNRCAPAISVAIGSPRVVISRAHPPDVALIAPLSREAVKTTGSPDLRGTVFKYSEAAETSYPAAWPSLPAAKDCEAASVPAPAANDCRKIRRLVLNMICAPNALWFQKSEVSQTRNSLRKKPGCSRVTRDNLEPDALHPAAHRDQRQHQSDAAEQSDRTKIIAKKLRRLLQFGDHSDECGHGTLARLLFRQSGRERQTPISYYQPGGFAL